ncbi:SDR family NAD(P)-dependent oxidoreductase [Streptomyces sp. GD-15H]|uniref:type I polyketide synthase n=1 Tax=Streptomyces sp. GD-15H TaxID=3129112 RepID=UPI003247B6A0
MTAGQRGVAVVGLAGRFPGAGGVEEFWANVCGGVESIVPLEEEELAAAGVPPEVFGRSDYVRAAPRFEGAGLFDAEFFGYTAREAEVMDPQHRLFLETCWQALEDAGYDAARFDGSVGVFGGAGANRYLQHVLSRADLVEMLGLTQILVGNEVGFLASRVAYKLDLTGPAVSMRTACSTALVAVHTACRSLLDHECDMALSGGVHVDPEPDTGYLYQDGSFLSPDGHVRPFDAEARGTVFGSGVGVVVLKRLEDALADGDTIHAVVKGSAIGNDGAVKVGFTAPSVAGQARTITKAFAVAGVEPEEIDYIETHGTGTLVGDPIEVQALGRVFGGRGRCALGSVKGNVGHLDAAAGMAGLIKTVLAVEHGVLPPTVNHRRVNPEVDLAGGRFRVQTALEEWPRTGRARRAGVSAFGFGGSNAHVVVEQAPPGRVETGDARGVAALVLSARSERALEEATDRLAAHLRERRPELSDAAYTLAVGRRVFPYRRTVVGSDAEEIARALEARDPAVVTTGHTVRESAPVVFLFGGQGSQHPGMAGGLYRDEPVFREAVDECARLLEPLLETDIRDVLCAEAEDRSVAARLEETRWAQPALFVVQYALARLWQSWGITPGAVIGHSLGEWTAACVAGVFSLPDALALVALRGRLMQEQAPGGMLNTMADRSAVEGVLPQGVALAAHNGPRDCVVSGPHDALAVFAELAAERGWPTQRVATSHAFHCALMEPVVGVFTEAVAAVERRAPRVPVVSNVTGTWLTDAEAVDPGYWGRHIRSTVEFDAGVRTAAGAAGSVVLEIGPGQAFTGLARRILAAADAGAGAQAATALASLPHRRDRRTPVETLHRALALLWQSGAGPDWKGYYHGQHRRRIPLPTHPLHPRHHWLERRKPVAAEPACGGTKRRAEVADWFYAPSWRREALPGGELPEGRRWLVFTDRLGVGQALADRLRTGGAAVSLVAAGDAWRSTGSERYELDPRCSTDYDRLIAALGDCGAAPTDIVHAWSVTAMDDREREDEESAVTLGFESLIRLSQALARSADDSACRLWVLSNGLHNVTGVERLHPAKATLLGPCRVLPREMPRLRCRAVDLDLAAGPTSRLLDRVMAELSQEPGPGTEIVAHRGIHRWVQHFTTRPLPAPGRKPTLRSGGTYLITGGTGDLGLELAEHLAARGARIVLTGRTPLPPAQDWAAWLANNPGDGRVATIVRRLSRLRETGTEILVVQADVADREAMGEAVARAVRRWGAIDGVFHAAGVPGGGLVQLKNLRSAEKVLLPKVRGTLVLEEALADQDLDFMLLFGSNGANIGSAGQVDYCAANCFLDAFAQDRSRHRRVIAIDWGPWRGVGMAVNTPVPTGMEQARQQSVELRGMTVAEGLRALETILDGADEPQIVVSPVELGALFAEALSPTDEGTLLRARATAAADAAIGAAPVPKADDIERAIGTVWQDLLGVGSVGSHDNFFELGGNSLVAIQLVNVINARLGCKVTLADLYEGLTVAHLAKLAASPAPADTGGRAFEERRENMQKRREYQQRRRAARGQR